MHLVLGANGAGKTSLLEAIYLLTTTKSFRTSQLEDCAGWGEEGFHLRGEIESPQRMFLELGWEPGRRYRAVNGSGAPLASHLGVQPTVSWTAVDREVLSGQPVHRRRFVDQGVVALEPASLALLARYRRVLGQKKRLLAVGGGGLDSWNELLAEDVTKLVALRRQYVERLGAVVRELAAEDGIPLPDLDLRYRPSIDAAGGVEQVLARLAEARRREREAKRALLGPHRDEIEVLCGGRLARRVASAGEQKLIGLLLTLARGRLLEEARRAPVYLLDDADAELDRERLEALWPLLRQAAQVIVTSNRPAVWEGLRGAHRWRVEGGRMEPRQKTPTGPQAWT